MAEATTNETAIQEHKTFVPSETHMPELTFSAVALGTILGLIFSASSLYLVLKVGMTVSATIPVAVLAITVFRGLSRAFGLRRATILENNVVQTAGSAGESIAFGAGVTMPALLMLGFDMDLTRVMVVSVLGGLLGILAMIPLRRAFIVRMHKQLLYPEGTAAAQVLISGEKGGTTGATVFIGFGVAFVHKFFTLGMNLLRETVQVPVRAINQAAVFAADMASELLGVGYIIGFRTSAIMMAGAILGYLVIIPIIFFIGEHAPSVIPPSESKLIKDMSIGELRNNYLLFIGAGCVASAGLISMGRTLPMIVRSARAGMATIGGATADTYIHRTDRDMPMSVVLWGSVGLLVLLTAFMFTEVGLVRSLVGALLVLLFGFLFVTVSSRLTGEIGSSSNPISGMTTATLMVTCLIFLAVGMEKEEVLALSVAAVVCIAASNGGTTAQSLKTGYLVGGTPKAMQFAILIGALVSALVIGGTLLAFNAAGTVYTDDPQYLPMDLETKGVVTLTSSEMEKVSEKETYQGKEYLVWDTRRPTFSEKNQDRLSLLKAPEGHFLVDPASGRVAFLKDPTIGGVVSEYQGAKTTRFPAPKTKLMQIIIQGVLSLKLNWSLVLIGAMMAVMLELCGVSSLAFAVGVYVPIQYSVPIFAGGLLRRAIDHYMARSASASIEAAGSDADARAQAEIEAIRKSETSPGVLLASGYIAGGSLAGVLVAFLEFSPTLKGNLNLGKIVSGLDNRLFLGLEATDWLALAGFGLLIGFAALVAMGKLLMPPAEENGNMTTGIQVPGNG